MMEFDHGRPASSQEPRAQNKQCRVRVAVPLGRSLLSCGPIFWAREPRLIPGAAIHCCDTIGPLLSSFLKGPRCAMRALDIYPPAGACRGLKLFDHVPFTH